MIPPAFALAYVDPRFLDSLSDAELLAAAFDLEYWLRPEQRIPRSNWRSCGFIAGRGFGKSHSISVEVNRRVEAGEARSIALMAPTLMRVKEVQVQFLVDTSPPWFHAEPYKDGVRWPNGVEALAFTPEAPGRPRSGNFDLSWMCELVDWGATTRLEAYQNLAAATRIGKAQIIWDTTSKGKNEVIQHLLRNHAQDPTHHIIRRGSLYDNPLLPKLYIRDTVSQYVPGSRQKREEIDGEVFTESAGALWQQAWLDTYRASAEPTDLDLILVGLDPSLSGSPDADECGLSVAGRDPRKHYHVLADHSCIMPPNVWASTVVEECAKRSAGVVLERNHAGDLPRDMIKLEAEKRNMRVEVLDKDRRFPPRRPGVIYIREYTTRNDKGSRAAPSAVLYQSGRVHHLGVHDKLELEMTLWEPGDRKSPNRLDACCYAINELAEIRFDEQGNRAQAISDAVRAQQNLQSLLRTGGTRIGL